MIRIKKTDPSKFPGGKSEQDFYPSCLEQDLKTEFGFDVKRLEADSHQNKNAVIVSKRLESPNGQIGGSLVFLSSESIRAVESLILKKTDPSKFPGGKSEQDFYPSCLEQDLKTEFGFDVKRPVADSHQNKNAVIVSKRLESPNGQIGGSLVFLSSESIRAVESLILKKTRAIKSLMFEVLRSCSKQEG